MSGYTKFRLVRGLGKNKRLWTNVRANIGIHSLLRTSRGFDINENDDDNIDDNNNLANISAALF